MDVLSEHRYEILATLGQGGFGTVYRARFVGEAGFEKQVAIKILNENLRDVSEVAMRLRDEARILGLLDHRAIVRVDRLVQINQTWAVVMEYVHGVDLKQLLETGPIPPKHAMEIVAEVSSALAAAFDGTGHGGSALGLVHRDIKPENIHITAAGDIKVLDFGIARAEFNQREALTSQIHYGSPSYMAPERFDQTLEDPDKSSIDIYALGTVLYEMVLGEHFGRTSPIQARHDQFLSVRIGKLRQVRVPEAVVTLCERMLAYNEAERPGPREIERTALALVANLEGEPLRYWAETRVPQMIPDAVDIPVEMSRFLAEKGVAVYSATTGTIASNANAKTSESRPSSLGLWLVVALVAVSVVTGVWVGIRLNVAPKVPEEASNQVYSAPVQVPTRVQNIAPDPVKPAPIPEPTAKTPPQPSAPTPAARPSAPTKSHLTAPPDDDRPYGTIQLTGDAVRVVLVGTRNRYAADGRVPPGRYSIAVDFGSGELHGQGALQIDEGQEVTIRCDRLLESCVVY